MGQHNDLRGMMTPPRAGRKEVQARGLIHKELYSLLLCIERKRCVVVGAGEGRWRRVLVEEFSLENNSIRKLWIVLKWEL